MQQPTRADAETRAKVQADALAKLARLQVSGQNIQAILQEAIKTAAEVLEVERSSVWLYTEDRTKIHCTALYQKEEDEHSSGSELTETEYPHYFEALRSERTIAADVARSDPRTSEFASSYLTPLGITSMLDAPIRTGGRMVGVVCNEHIGPPRAWTLDEQTFAASLSDLISLALETSESKRAQALLAEYNRTLEAKVDERTAELREQQSRLSQAEKLAALGSFVAGIAHEINTPLGALQSNTDTIKYAIEQLKEKLCSCSGVAGVDTSIKLVESIEDLCRVDRIATGRISHLVSSLKSFARLDRAVQDEADVHEGLESALILVNHQLKGRIQINKNYGSIPRISCYPNQINQVFMIILVNAIQAIVGPGTISIRTYSSDGRVFIEFSDTGVGIPPENLSRIFDPGFTTKGVKVGTGLGLSIASRIVSDHSGRIEVSSTPGRGSSFLVVLPVKPVMSGTRAF
jgi:two-component system, NtrC family, sensor kinase